MRLRGRELSETIDRIVASLRANDVPVSPEQIIDAHDVALMLVPRSGGEVESELLKHSLASVFCANPAEVAAFHAEFDSLLETSADPAVRKVTPEDPRQRRPRQPAVIRRWQWTRSIGKAAAFVALFAGAVWLALYFTEPDQTQTTQVKRFDQPGLVGPSTSTDPPPVDDRPSVASFQPPPRPPAPVVVLRDNQVRWISVLIWLIVAVPIAFGLSTMLRQFIDRRFFLASDRSNTHPTLKPIPIAEAALGLYRFARLASPVTRLRQPKRIETRRLDARRTVEKTIDNGGFPEFAFVIRSRRPGYVMLIERRNAIDFFAHAAKSLADYLHGAGLEVYAFAFKGRPYRLMPLWKKGQQVSYQEILQRFHGDALVLAGDPGTMRRGNVVGANTWDPDMKAWCAAGLLSSNACELWGREEDWFYEQKFSVAEFGSDGFAELSAWLSREEVQPEPQFAWEPSVDSLYPPLLAADPERWLDDSPDEYGDVSEELPQLLEQLMTYLKADGMYLLGAVAAYPELRWPIARFLNETLFADDGGERRLLRIARLPWCREGEMPAYLREALLRALSVEQKANIQAAYYRLLNDSYRTRADAPKVEIADPGSKTFRELLEALFDSAPPGPYLDYIFQSVMLDEPVDMLGIEVSRQRSGQVGSRYRSVLPGLFKTARLYAIVTAIVAFAAFVWAKPMATGTLEDRTLLQNGAVTVTLFHYTEDDAIAAGSTIRSTEFLARRLQWALEARGFGVTLQPVTTSAQQMANVVAQEFGNFVDLSEPARNPLAQAITPNFVFYFPDVGVSLLESQVGEGTASNLATTPMSVFASVIAEEIRFATYGQPVQTTAIDDDFDPNALVDIGQPGEAAYLETPNAINVLLAEDTRAFQDRLIKGGLGPVMNLIGDRDADSGTDFSPDMPFAIGKYEVTFDEYDRFAVATGRDLPDDAGWGRGRRPVINVTRLDAEAYAAWLSEATDERYRLPRDEEWQYAWRLGFASGAGLSVEDGESNFNDTFGETLLVGSFPATSVGLHDLQGNVSEWVSNCGGATVDSDVIGTTDRASNCITELVRGISWERQAGTFNSPGARTSLAPGTAHTAIGFRVLRELASGGREDPFPAEQAADDFIDQAADDDYGEAAKE